MPSPITRREFIGQSSCAALGSLGLLSTLLNLRMANSALANSLPPGEDFRALVCLFFSGGMDSYNLLLPASGAPYDAYALTRGGVYDATTNADGLALPASTLLALASAPTDPFSFAVHPRSGNHGTSLGIQSLYGAGKLAFVSNVGTLVERVTKTKYNSSTAKLPRGLYSHADQIQQWHTSVPTETVGIGWAGSAADLLQPSNADQRVSMNISLGGQNVWQTGKTVFPYTIGSSGSTLPSNYNSPLASPTLGQNNRTAFRTAGIDSLIQQQHQHILDEAFTSTLKDSVDSSVAFKDAFDNSTLTTLFPGDAGYNYPSGYTASNDPARTLAQNLKAVVRTLKARQTLGMRRQTYFVNYGGWDHHDEVILTMDTMIDVVNRSLAAYWEALGEVGLRDHVTLYTASDFARTLTSNGAGSDHAWGGNAFVLGGCVAGGKVYGNFPDLSLSGSQVVTGRGVTLPGISVDEYFAELARWLGVQNHQLSSVLPRISEFYTPSATPPVGFMMP